MAINLKANPDGISGAIQVNGVDAVPFTTKGLTSGLSNRNKIINGSFSINQRVYVSGAAIGTGLYGHDRWKMSASADTYTFSTTANKTTITIPAGKVLRQVIEGLNLQTGTYVLSWEGTAQGKIGSGSLGASGITGAITGGVDTTIEFGPGTVANVQLEIGTIATPFEHRPIGAELALCQRYCLAPTLAFGAQYLTTGSTYEVNLPVMMRATPTMLLALTILDIIGGGSASGYGALTLGGVRPNFVRLFNTHNAIGAIGTPVQATLTGIIHAEL